MFKFQENCIFTPFSYCFLYKNDRKQRKRSSDVSPKHSSPEKLDIAFSYTLDSSHKRALRTYLLDIKFVFQTSDKTYTSDRYYHIMKPSKEEILWTPCLNGLCIYVHAGASAFMGGRQTPFSRMHKKHIYAFTLIIFFIPFNRYGFHSR